MSKKLKCLVTVCLVICLTAFAALFATACNEPSDYFTVTVKLNDTTPAVGVEAKLCTLDGSMQTCFDNGAIDTDKDGVVKFNLKDICGFDVSDSTKFQIKLHNLPTGYIYANESGAEFAEGDGMTFDTKVTGYSVTIVLTAKS